MQIDKYDLFFMDSCTVECTHKVISNKYDLFISAYNEEEMVSTVYDIVDSDEKAWLIFPDYQYEDASKLKLLEGRIFRYDDIDTTRDDLEMFIIMKFINDINLLEEYKKKKICIDITGFVKPYMLYLMLCIKNSEFVSIDIIYSEPKIYGKKEETDFSKDIVIKTRSINGFDLRTEESNNDLFIINAGYDHKLIRSVARQKIQVAKQKVLIGFPSLQPIMFQENILNFQKASDELRMKENNFNPLLAPANDPFETAKTLNNYVNAYIKKVTNVKNIYLSPIGTKPQALGILLFYMFEGDRLLEDNINIKLIYPFTKSYSTSAGKELFKINKYTIEFDLFDKLFQ